MSWIWCVKIHMPYKNTFLKQISQQNQDMATYTLALSTSKPFFSCPKQPFQSRLNPTNKFHVSNSCDQSSHKHVLSLQPTSSSFSSRNNSILHTKRLWNLIVRSEAVPESRIEVANTNDWVRTLQLAAMFAIWYTLNIYFNIFNKQVSFSLFILFLSQFLMHVRFHLMMLFCDCTSETEIQDEIQFWTMILCDLC